VVFREGFGTMAARREDKLREKEHLREIINLRAQILKHVEAKKSYSHIQAQIDELFKKD
jgi:hypothetical protein